ncbi:MAG: metallophosphoesterase [Agathobacter sp.]|nr:metallophosphoesterase [Agathobacter sp.]
MKKQSKPVIFLAMNVLLIFNLLVYFGIRSMWSGIVRYTFKPMPYILLAVLVATVLGVTTLSMNKKYPLPVTIWAGIVNILFLGLDAYIISLTTEATHYFIREFSYGLLYIGIIALLVFTVTYVSKMAWFQKKWIPSVLMIVLFVGGLFIALDISLVNGIDKTPVVYAVEDTYQITFTSQAKGEAWVVIDGVEYNDTYAGYRETESTIHKISVPMDVLDKAGEYTVYTRAMILRGPYESLQGKTISATYNWKGVNETDGINYYVISDNHNTHKTPLAAASYFGDDLDMLICCGDTVSWIDREADLTQFLYLASDITKGEVPVIYARGNHETKGVKAHEYYNYVGADGENYYYTFRLGSIWGIVLDVGEDHGDNFIEYAGVAKFNTYRDEQTVFLDEVLANAENEFNAEGVTYRIAVCHIPLTVKYVNDHAGAYKNAWIERLNQMKLTVLYGGHVHELWYIDPAFEDGSTLTQVVEYSGKEENNSQRTMTNATFPSILVSKRGDAQSPIDPEKVFDTGFIGLAVTVEGDETIMKYTDDEGNVLETRSPWFSDIVYGDEIRAQNVR